MSQTKAQLIDNLVQPITGALGSASAPTFSFTSDPNTGLYSPGADQLALATGGTGRLFVDASGRVLIGVSSTSSTSSLLIQGNTDQAVVRLATGKSALTGTDILGQLVFTDSGHSTAAAIRVFKDTGTWTSGTSQPTGLLITTTPDGSAVALERLRITSAGNVGIGTTSATERLEVIGNINIDDVNGRRLGFKVGDTFTASTTTAHYGLTFGAAGANTVGLSGYGGLAFYSSGQERFRCDGSGRLLVGTSSASAADATIIAQGNAQNSTFGSRLYLARGEATPGDNAGLGHLNFSDSTHTVSAMIRALRDGGTWSGSSKPTRLEFSTTPDSGSSPVERLRITSNGQLGAFTAAANDALYVSSGEGAGTTYRVIQGRYGATANFGGTISFNVFTNGNVQNTNNSYGAISDIKLKENIVDANSQWDDLKALQVRNYNFKEGQTHTQIGLVAQEAELVSPGLVGESPDRDEDGNDLGTVTKSVNYSVLYMKAVKALQEAMERIEQLEQRLTDAGIN